MSYLRYLCLFAYSDVQHIMCCDCVFDFFLRLVYPMLPVWIVHFWLPLRYSLTFISKQDVVNWYVHTFMPRPRTDNVTHSYYWILFPAGSIICRNVINWGNYSQIYHNYYKKYHLKQIYIFINIYLVNQVHGTFHICICYAIITYVIAVNVILWTKILLKNFMKIIPKMCRAY